MFIVKWTLIAIIALAIAAVAVGRMGWLGGSVPSDLGIREGRLRPPSATPNSVSSQAALYPNHGQRTYAAIAPLLVKGSGAATLSRIKSIVESLEGGEVVKSEDGYLYARFTSRIMKYIDDSEFWLDASANAVQVRSASRLGSKDFGVNRARIETIRRRLEMP